MKRSVIRRIFIFVFLGLFLIWIPKLFSESDTLLAKFGETIVTQRDLDEYIKKYTPLGKDKPPTPEQKKMVLDNLIKGFLISKESEREKMDQKPEFKSHLKLYRSDLLIQEYINTKMKPSITVTEKDIEEKLKENPNLIPKESLTLKEILVKTEEESGAIYEELKKGGDFSKIATEKSIAKTKVTGGHMRPISRGQLPKALEEVAFNLKKGEFSKPIKTEEGYYILYLQERIEKPAEEIKRQEKIIKEKIRQIEISKKIADMVEKKAAELRGKTKIEVYYDRIQ